MKKLFSVAIFLVVLFSAKSFAQETKEQTKEQIKPALLVIDIQNVYLNYVPEREKTFALYYINQLIGLFHKYNFPVIRIYHHDVQSGPHPGDNEFEYPASVEVNKDDPKIIKTYGDGFNKTDLDKVLKEKGCNTLFLCGLSAVGCVLATWIGAHNHDYKAFLVKNALMSHNSDYTDNVEDMFDAINYDAVELLVSVSGK